VKAVLILVRWQQIPGNHTEWCSIGSRLPFHWSADIRILALQLQDVIRQRAGFLLRQRHQLRLLHLHIPSGAGGRRVG